MELLALDTLSAREREAALRRLIAANRASDPRLGATVAAFFPDYSPEVLALLLSKMPRDDQRGNFLSSYCDYLVSFSEIRLLTAHLKSMPPGDDRSTILQAIAGSAPLFSPATLTQFEKLFATNGDRSDFALGIYERLSGIRGDGPLLAEAKQYLRASPSSVVSQVIMQAVVKRGVFSDVDGLSDWLLELPPDTGKIGDLPMLTRMADVAPRKGIDYLQKLQDQVPDGVPEWSLSRRANEALEGFAEQYSRCHPGEAFLWALNLPESLGDTRSRVLVTAYGSLYLIDPALADQYAESVTDTQALKSIRSRQHKAAGNPGSPAAKKARTAGKVARSESKKGEDETPEGTAPADTGF